LTVASEKEEALARLAGLSGSVLRLKGWIVGEFLGSSRVSR
jgi:hypothetical protein